MDAFGRKLAFVMKALSLSRGRLSADVSVDKSVVSRWLSGARTPTSNNLAAVTALIARRAPGFTMHDWDLPLAELGARLGLDGGPAAAPGTPENIQTWLDLPQVRAAAGGSAEPARAAAGFGRSLAPMPGNPQQLGQSFAMLSVNPDGTMRVETGFFTMRRLGWSVAVGQQFFGCITGTTDGYFAFTIFNHTPTPVLDVMDGIFLGCLADNGGVPIAMPVVMERIEDLSGDPAADALRLSELLASNPVLAASEAPEAVRRRLAAGMAAAQGPSPSPLLMMAALESLAAGRMKR